MYIFEKISSYSTLEIVWYITIFLFVASSVSLLALIYWKVLIEKNRNITLDKKIIFISKLQETIFFGDSFDVKLESKFDYYALADAIMELNNLLTQEDKTRLHEIIQDTKLDQYILNRYNTIWFDVKKRFYLTKIIYIEYPKYKDFIFDLIDERADTDIHEQLLYGYAALCSSDDDLHKLSLKIDNFNSLICMSKMHEYIYTVALKHVSDEQIISFVKNRNYNTLFARNITVAIGDLKRGTEPIKARIIYYLYKIYKNEDMFMLAFLNTINKLGIGTCSVIKSNYLTQTTAIRIKCSLLGIKFCKTRWKEFLYIYLFDNNTQVRNFMFQSCLQYNVKRDEILATINLHNINFKEDKLFMKMFDIYYPKVLDAK